MLSTAEVFCLDLMKVSPGASVLVWTEMAALLLLGHHVQH